jgi:tRNA threonylcarbamoyladenosine biosynthesis protein TsaB
MHLSIDTASSLASIALSRDGEVTAERAWECRRNHTVELLPAIDGMLRDAGVTNADLTAVFADIGPGMYTGLRVGISTGQGLARALGLPLVGVGRLELDAWPHRAFAGEVIAVHRAGRGDLAWAAHRGGREVSGPLLSKPLELAGYISGPTLVAGEVDDALQAVLHAEAGTLAQFAPDGPPRALALAALGHERLRAGGDFGPALVRPLYLRPPAIGPQEPS